MRTLIAFLVAIVLLAIWEWRGGVSAEFRFFFRQPSEIFAVTLDDVRDWRMTSAIGYTLSHVGLGYLAGSLLGICLGLLLWRLEWLGKALNNILIGLSSIPVFALAPLLIVWFGVGLWAKVIVVVVSIVFSTTYQVYKGACRVDDDFKELKFTFGLSERVYVRRVLFPGTFRESLGTLKLNLGFALIGGFVAEWISSQNGIGHYILAAMGTYDYARVFSGIIVLFAISLIFSGMAVLLERVLTSRGRRL